jgi:single-stranded-DNA-specific exonuclease
LETVWKLKSVDNDVVEYIRKEFKLPEIYARIMYLRGIQDRPSSREFFFSDQTRLHDPFLMTGMEKAVKKILNQIAEKKSILVFGDYDVDGTTGTSMFYLFLKSLGADVYYYIPSREQEGYGLSNNGIDYAQKIGVSLLISVDCGINAFEKIDYAGSLGIDTIITDHHRPDHKLPNAFSILNPNQKECNYPFKGLCGAGVVFKFALAICERGGFDPELAWQHADLIALGTAADLVPILDENRIIVEKGLALIETGNKTGIQALLKTSGMFGKEITVGRLVFWLAPKINAAGRLGDAGRAVKLLISSNPVYAFELAKELEIENKKRQDITTNITEDAVMMVNSQVDLENEHAIVLASRDWHAGVIGIVASRIRELYNRPVFIISVDENGVGKASGRSTTKFNLYDTLEKCNEDLIAFGGHPIAAGLTINESDIPKFRKNFIRIANDSISKSDLIPSIRFDGNLQINQIDGRFVKFLKAMSPYGPGNMRPKFLSKNVSVAGNPKVLGKDRDTIKFTVKEGKAIFEAIGFRMIEHYEKLILNKPIDIAYEIGENDWNGNTTIQLELKDIKIGT